MAWIIRGRGSAGRGWATGLWRWPRPSTVSTILRASGPGLTTGTGRFPERYGPACESVVDPSTITSAPLARPFSHAVFILGKTSASRPVNSAFMSDLASNSSIEAQNCETSNFFMRFL